jgi:hypothetical protein
MPTKRILAFVRRINLDAFWARATSTVKNNLGIVLRDIAAMKNLGLPVSYFDPGPSPASDHDGYEAAISVIEDTRRPGKYADDHKQWDSSRKVKSAIGSFERTAVCSPLSYLALVNGEQGHAQRFQFDGMSSLWSQIFAQGCRSRMGQDIRKNLALDFRLWHRVLDHCQDQARAADHFNDGVGWIIAGAYFVFSLVLSLRGPEGFMFEISLLEEHKERHKGLVWLPIIGKLKGDDRSKTHFLRSVPTTGSGIPEEKWRDWLLSIHHHAGRTEGPAMCDDQGFLLTNEKMNTYLWEALEFIYQHHPKDFPKAITKEDDIRSLMQVNRSPRRSSESQATRKRVLKEDKDVVNQWSNEVRAKGKAVSEALSLAYTDQALLDECFQRCTSTM